MQNKILSTNFNEKEFLEYLREVSHDIEDYGPDLIKVRPDIYNQIEAKSEKLNVYASPSGLPLHSYYGVPIEIDYKMTEPYKIIRGGEEI